jgi:UDP-N-acetylmuramate dehydrogenase
MALPACAEFFCRAETLEDIRQALSFARQRQLPVAVFGGGSNIILAGDVPGLMIQIAIEGMAIEDQPDNTALVTAGAGENWHELVVSMVAKQLYGVENLVLIPGLVGAAPIQNIGAYGVELSNCFVSLDAIEIITGKVTRFTGEDCKFAYRQSAFKGELQGLYIITSVTLKLHKDPELEVSYPALRDELAKNQSNEITPQLVCETIAEIRRSKLPDPAIDPNVGSFFKNPVISSERANALVSSHPGLITYPQNDGLVKVPAAGLIESAGWKGVNVGPCAVHRDHALVLTHSGDATGQDVLALADQIIEDIKRRFNIELEMEPQVIGA